MCCTFSCNEMKFILSSLSIWIMLWFIKNTVVITKIFIEFELLTLNFHFLLYFQFSQSLLHLRNCPHKLLICILAVSLTSLRKKRAIFRWRFAARSVLTVFTAQNNNKIVHPSFKQSVVSCLISLFAKLKWLVVSRPQFLNLRDHSQYAYNNSPAR